PKGEFFQWNAGSDDVDLLFIATEFDDGMLQRGRADKDPGNGVEHLTSRSSIRRLVHVDQDVGAMKGNHARFRPRSQQRKKVDGDMPEKHMKKLHLLAIKNGHDFAPLVRRDLPRLVANLPKP